ncbi:hypothetical protein Scep_007541 [Stephania cephalantha]|uniref:DUF4283 domain-containing protein n=1 Tax=Stephania cephalantha TaxID=152367 RepID=A0AAP0KBT2_9MAGN
MADDLTRDLARFTLSEREAIPLRISLHPNSTAPKKCNLSIIGHLLTHKKYNKKGLKEALMKEWNIYVNAAFSKVETNIFQISFAEIKMRYKVLNSGPWLFERCLFPVMQWREVLALIVDSFTTIGKRIGAVVEMGEGLSTKRIEPRKFMLVKVEIPLKTHLTRGLCLEDEEKNSKWVSFKYERLPAFCYYCGCLNPEEPCCPSKTEDRNKGPPQQSLKTLMKRLVKKSQAEEDYIFLGKKVEELDIPKGYFEVYLEEGGGKPKPYLVPSKYMRSQNFLIIFEPIRNDVVYEPRVANCSSKEFERALRLEKNNYKKGFKVLHD